MILEIGKLRFHLHRSLIVIDNIGIDKIANKVSFGKKDIKYFIGYNNPEKVRRLCIFLPKMSAYRRNFDKTKCMFS